MADRKITDLTALAAGSQATGDLLTIVDVSEGAAADKNKKITVESLFKGIPGNVGINTASPAGTFGVDGAAFFGNQSSSGSTDGVLRIVESTSSVYLQTGTNTSTGSSAALVFSNINASNEWMRIDSSGRLLLGTTTQGHSTADLFTIASSSSNGMTIRSGSSSSGQISFSDGTTGDAEYRGQILYDHGGDFMRFRTGGDERMRIDSSGRVGIGVTNPGHSLTVKGAGSNTAVANFFGGTVGRGLVILTSNDGGTGDDTVIYNATQNSGSHVFQVDASEKVRIQSGGGISFNGDTAQANALDDYEEGTFTPFSATQISDHSITIPAQAHYVKIGRLVQIWMRALFTGTTSAQVTGNMPFPCSNPTSTGSASPFFLTTFPDTSSPSDMLFTYMGTNNTTAFTIYRNNDNYSSFNFNSGPTEITIIGCYRST
jgi:hypothetical protein